LAAALCAALAGLALTAVADQKLDNAINDLDQKFAQVKSYSSHMKSMSTVDMGPGHSQKTEMTGRSEWVRQGDVALQCTEMKCDTAVTKDGKTTKTPSTIKTVCDGKYLYVLTIEGDQKRVMKNPAQPAQKFSPKAMFDQMRSYYEIKLLPDETVDGSACYVFELKMKPMEGMPPRGVQRMFFQKSTGVMVKSEGLDADGKLTQMSVTSNIKINPDINTSHFKFDMPSDAVVMDMTGAQQSAQASSVEEAPPAEESTEERTPAEEEKPAEEGKDKKPKLPKLPKLR
jgi:outer membrane lipoprotein-sorting protein